MAVNFPSGLQDSSAASFLAQALHRRSFAFPSKTTRCTGVGYYNTRRLSMHASYQARTPAHRSCTSLFTSTPNAATPGSSA